MTTTEEIQPVGLVGMEDSKTRTRRTNPTVNIEMVLREEVRALRELWMKVLQWGVTVMIAAGSVIFYARRAIKEDLVASGFLKIGDPIPIHIYLVGTTFLVLLAIVFSVLSGLTSRRYRSYFDQLVRNSKSGINDEAASGHSRWILPWIFWLFPIFDILLRAYYFEIAFSPK